MKTGIVSILLFSVLSCNKETFNRPPPVATTQSEDKTILNTFHIGDSYGGGIIFYIDGTGQHGLIAAKRDTGDRTGRMRWGSAAFILSGATGTAVGTGAVNTQKIIKAEGQQLVYAARLCANYRGGGFADWFLPSKDELYQLYLQKNVVGGFVYGAYWSSSEFDHALAWGKYFYNDIAQYSHKDRFNGVRAVRTF
jgi:hypothetical protein